MTSLIQITIHLRQYTKRFPYYFGDLRIGPCILRTKRFRFMHAHTRRSTICGERPRYHERLRTSRNSKIPRRFAPCTCTGLGGEHQFARSVARFPDAQIYASKCRSHSRARSRQNSTIFPSERLLPKPDTLTE